MHHNAAAAIRRPQEGIKLVVHVKDNQALGSGMGAGGGSTPRGDPAPSVKDSPLR